MVDVISTKIKKILVPLDGSKNSLRGLDNAIYFARVCGATITGLAVIGNLPVSGIHNVASWRKNWVKEAKKQLAKARKYAAQNGVDLKEKICYGNPGSEIAEYARKNNFDLIVIGARGIGAIKETFLGSTSQYVIHKAKSPVVIVK